METELQNQNLQISIPGARPAQPVRQRAPMWQLIRSFLAGLANGRSATESHQACYKAPSHKSVTDLSETLRGTLKPHVYPLGVSTA